MWQPTDSSATTKEGAVEAFSVVICPTLTTFLLFWIKHVDGESEQWNVLQLAKFWHPPSQLSVKKQDVWQLKSQIHYLSTVSEKK